MSKFLEKNEYAKIRSKAKKMGAESWQFKYIDHNVFFKHTIVAFAFYPLKYNVSILGKTNFLDGYFSTKEEAEEIKKDMDLALEFIEYLKEFNAQLLIKEK